MVRHPSYSRLQRCPPQIADLFSLATDRIKAGQIKANVPDLYLAGMWLAASHQRELRRLFRVPKFRAHGWEQPSRQDEGMGLLETMTSSYQTWAPGELLLPPWPLPVM